MWSTTLLQGAMLGLVRRENSERVAVGDADDAGGVVRLAGGEGQAIAEVLAATGTEMGINAAYIERLNATTCGSFRPLSRRSRAMNRDTEALTVGMYLAGCAYIFC
jgi:hypothetical protein